MLLERCSRKTCFGPIDTDLDAASCGPVNRVPDPPRLKIAPVEFAWSVPPDGTLVAFPGARSRSS
jgi:hypothetical protein